MFKRYSLVILIAMLLALAACGGDEAPTPAPTSQPTFTPTAAPTVAPTKPPATIPTVPPTAAPTSAPTSAPTEAPASPLAAPDSPPVPPAAQLAAPASPLAPPSSAVPVVETTPVITPVTGFWQLETIKMMAATQPITATGLTRLELSGTGAANVTADCRTGRGRYTQTAGSAIHFDIAYRDVRCAPDSLADGFANALARAAAYRFENGSLVLTYGDQGGEMSLTPVIQNTSFGAELLAWSLLENMTYFVEGMPTGDNRVTLVNGEFRVQNPADPAAELIISLATIHSYGDLDGDGTLDTVVILIFDGGAAGTLYYLTPVLNAGGLPIPLQPELLGDSIFVRDLHFEGSQVIIDVDKVGADNPACCPIDSHRLTYILENDRFKPVNDAPLGPPELRANLDAPRQELLFAPGITTMGLTGTLPFNGLQSFGVSAQAGQQLSATIQTPYNDVWLSIYGENDRVVLRSIRTESNTWSGMIPSTQNYIIRAVAAGSATPYTLTIELPGEQTGARPGDAIPTVAGANDPQQAQPSTEKVVYFTFDDGPVLPSTSTILDILARNNAKADFFVNGQQAETQPDGLAAQYNAGHGLGSHTVSHPSLSGISRDLFFQEISRTRDILGDQGSSCLRPPYGATDAYTRAYAAELGYTVVLWDVDSRDWSQPGVESIVGTVQSGVFPGAVVLLHDGGGERSQTHAALEQLLPTLAKQGYTFRTFCR